LPHEFGAKYSDWKMQEKFVQDQLEQRYIRDGGSERGGKTRKSNFPETVFKSSLRKCRRERSNLEKLGKFEFGL
jgi:hypothetical protein